MTNQGASPFIAVLALTRVIEGELNDALNEVDAALRREPDPKISGLHMELLGFYGSMTEAIETCVSDLIGDEDEDEEAEIIPIR